jgi:formylglycine-generating enzyme required for sulfatase activity
LRWLAAAVAVLALLVGAGLLLGTWAPPHDLWKPQPGAAPFDETKARALQRSWASYLGRPVEETLDLGGEKLTVLLVPPGTFSLGDPNGSVSDKPHRVTLTKAFYLGKYEVTQAQFEALMTKDKDHSAFSAAGASANKVKDEKTGRFPVDSVSWDDADAFCAALAKKSGRTVTLPTEAQWEWACRAGTDTPFSFGAECDGKQANCDGRSPDGTDHGGPYAGRTCAVGEYPANAWGFHDVHGNVREWCRDWYGPYSDLRESDPERVESASEGRVLRGGSWADAARNCRATARSYQEPSTRSERVGFRIVVRLD